MNVNANASLMTSAPAAWTALIGAVSIGGTLAFACGAPFAAIAALAAISLRRAEGLTTVVAAWAANQLIGFAVLGYPLETMSFVWGAVIGAAMVVAFLATRLTAAAATPALSAPLAFVAAFTVFQGAIYAASVVLGGTEAFTVDTISWILAINAIAYAGLIVLHFALKAIIERPSRIVASAG